MPAQINTIIPTALFEQCRDRIAEILLPELVNQATLRSDAELNVGEIWVERVSPFEVAETPAINVVFDQIGGEETGKTGVATNDVFTYFIDIYTSKVSEDDLDGQAHARKWVHKFMGVIRAILEDTRYNTLGFQPPSITRVRMQSMQMAAGDAADTENNAMGRVILQVVAPASLQTQTAVPIGGSDTTIKMVATDKGYKYTFNA